MLGSPGLTKPECHRGVRRSGQMLLAVAPTDLVDKGRAIPDGLGLSNGSGPREGSWCPMVCRVSTFTAGL
jgi:hypothetical protein